MGDGFSPFLISLGMVAGVFVARWTVPALLKGSGLRCFVANRMAGTSATGIVAALGAGLLWGTMYIP